MAPRMIMDRNGRHGNLFIFLAMIYVVYLCFSFYILLLVRLFSTHSLWCDSANASGQNR